MIDKDIQKKNDKIELLLGFIFLYSMGVIISRYDKDFGFFSIMALLLFGMYLYIWEYKKEVKE